MFDVYDLPHKTTVSLLKGRVEVFERSGRRARNPVELRSGQAVVYIVQRGLGRVATADLARIASWQARRVEFDDVTLHDAVEDFNRSSTTRVVIENRSLESIKVSGIIDFGDVRAFTRALHGAFGIRSRHQGQIAALLPPVAGRQ